MHVLEVGFIPEDVTPGMRLGRHVAHDARSKRYAVPAQDISTLVSKRHARKAPVFNQGDLGSCTGNAALGALGTGALYDAVVSKQIAFTEDTAVGIYSDATVLDPFPGTYKPTDTGSDGLSVAKVLQQRGYISGYQHALSMEAALTALQDNAIIIGVNWYSSMDIPDRNGMVAVGGTVRGGHEFVVDGIDVVLKRVWCTNSWGTSWGLNGTFGMSWDDFGRLLREEGDATVLVPITTPAPQPTPVPPIQDAADLALIACMEPWQRRIISTYTRAGKAAAAYRAWKRAKGY